MSSFHFLSNDSTEDYLCVSADYSNSSLVCVRIYCVSYRFISTYVTFKLIKINLLCLACPLLLLWGLRQYGHFQQYLYWSSFPKLRLESVFSGKQLVLRKLTFLRRRWNNYTFHPLKMKCDWSTYRSHMKNQGRFIFFNPKIRAKR